MFFFLQWMTYHVMLNEKKWHQLSTRLLHSERLFSIQCQWALSLFALVFILALMILKVLPMMKKNRQIFHPVNPSSKSLLYAAMLHVWVWFVLLYIYQFFVLSVFYNVIIAKSTVISTAYMPFVVIGYYAFGIMGLLYLVEFPFLLWYISTKVMAMDRRGLNRRQCMLNMLKSVGCAGMVLFMQVLPVYFVFHIVNLVMFPLLVLLNFCKFLLYFTLFTSCTALFFLPCITHFERCLPHCCSIIYFILCTFVCSVFMFIMKKEFDADTNNTLYDLGHILTILFTSGLIALLGYIIKRVVIQNKAEGYSPDCTTDHDGYRMIQPIE